LGTQKLLQGVLLEPGEFSCPLESHSVCKGVLSEPNNCFRESSQNMESTLGTHLVCKGVLTEVNNCFRDSFLEPIQYTPESRQDLMVA
jgi:hypothetical protein